MAPVIIDDEDKLRKLLGRIISLEGYQVTEAASLGEARRVLERGVIDILLCDYRQVPRPERGFDRVVSLEMLEHVGEKYMKQYFETISNLLNDTTGLMVIQGITMSIPVRVVWRRRLSKILILDESLTGSSIAP